MDGQISQRDLIEISLPDMERYLYSLGWTKSRQTNEKINVFLLPKTEHNQYLQLVLPSKKEYLDYYERIADAVNILSRISDKEAKQVIKEISLVNHDIFRARIINPSKFANSIPLTVASDDIKALRDLFIYSACSEDKGLPFFEKPLAVGLYHASLCQFGHTFDGSFGFTINSPVSDNRDEEEYEQLSLLEDVKEIPFERRVMERIIRGLNHVERAVKEDNGDIIVDNYEKGFNSRMCQALLDISQGMTKEVDYHISWSTQVELSEDISDKDRWHLSEASYRALEYAANELSKIEPYNETIIGQVVTLHSSRNPMIEEEFARQAIIKYEYDGKKIDVKLDLDRHGYDVVYNAHGRGLPVKIEGKLFRKGNTWRMIDIEEITMHIT